MSAATGDSRLGLDPIQQRAARFCTFCPKMCRFACPVAHGEANETSTPWAMMRLVNLIDRGYLAPDDSLFEALQHCVSCGRCTTFCRHGNPVAETLGAARNSLASAGHRLSEAWDVPDGGCHTAVRPPSYLADRADLPVFLPSCAHLASEDESDRLRASLEALERVGLPLSVPVFHQFPGCGFHEWEVGREGDAVDSFHRFSASGRGRPLCISDCAPSIWALERRHPEEEGRVIHLVEWLVEGLAQLPRTPFEGVVGIHDACFVSRRLGLGEAVRSVVTRLVGRAPIDLFESGDSARCCGSQGVWADAHGEARDRSAGSVVDDIADSQVDRIVTASTPCRRTLERLVRQRDVRGPAGRLVEVLDLLDLIAVSAPAA